MTYDMSCRHALKLFNGAAAAAAITLPCGFSQRVAAQEAALAYQGDIEVWDWEFATRQAEAEAIIADWKTCYPEINLSYQVLPYADA